MHDMNKATVTETLKLNIQTGGKFRYGPVSLNLAKYTMAHGFVSFAVTFNFMLHLIKNVDLLCTELQTNMIWMMFVMFMQIKDLIFGW